MGVHNGADAFLMRQPLHHVQDKDLVVEVQTGLRLVQNNELGVVDKGTGNEHHLQFAAAHPVAVLVGKVRDAHPLHHGFGHFQFLFTGLLEHTQMGTAAQQNHFQSGIGERKPVGLRDVGNGAPHFLRLQGVDILTIEQGLAAVPRQQTDHAFEQSGLADAVGSKDGKNVSLFQCQVDIFQYGRLSGVAETAILHLQDHRRLLLVLFSREMNTGAPMMAVRMESGSSMMLMVRDSVSIRIMKLAPRLRLTGTT